MPSLLVVVLAFALASPAFAAGLVDNPIDGDWLQYLDGKDWAISANEPDKPWLVGTGTVPGDLITDLFASGLIPGQGGRNYFLTLYRFSSRLLSSACLPDCRDELLLGL